MDGRIAIFVVFVGRVCWNCVDCMDSVLVVWVRVCWLDGIGCGFAMPDVPVGQFRVYSGERFCLGVVEIVCRSGECWHLRGRGVYSGILGLVRFR